MSESEKHLKRYRELFHWLWAELPKEQQWLLDFVIRQSHLDGWISGRAWNPNKEQEAA